MSKNRIEWEPQDDDGPHKDVIYDLHNSGYFDRQEHDEQVQCNSCGDWVRITRRGLCDSCDMEMP